MKRIRIGTRGSKLALRQAELVQEAIKRERSGVETQIVVLHTKGDKILDKPLVEIGDKGVFVSELEQALLAGEIDLAVHSAKDLPMQLAEGLCIAAVLPRGDVRDVLVVPKGTRVPWISDDSRSVGDIGSMAVSSCSCRSNRAESAQEAQRTFVIGTGSRRRRRQAMTLWENVTCEDIRGNVDTRLRKLQNSVGNAGEREGNPDIPGKEQSGSSGTENAKRAGYDGIILAKAGLDRLEIMSHYEAAFDFYPLAPEQFLPAACQGIIAVEAVRDSDAAALCGELTDADTELSFLVEREVLARLAADCSDATAAWCRQEQERLILDVMYAGKRQQVIREEACRMEGVQAAESVKAAESVQAAEGAQAAESVKAAERAQAADRTARIQTGLAMAKEAAGLVKGKDIT